MKKKITTMFIFSAFFLVFALDDLPIYLDAGCPNTGIPKSYAQGPADMKLPQSGASGAIPITCTEAMSGSDAAIVNLDRKLKGGEYFDFIFKWGDDRSHSIKGYKDLRMWIKNRNSTTAKFRITWEQANYSTGKYKNMEIPGGGDWKEYVIDLAELGSDSVAGFKISNPLGEYNGPDLDADPINILIDSITVTDGTNNNMKKYNENPYPFPATSAVHRFSYNKRQSGKLIVEPVSSGVRLKGWQGKADVAVYSLGGQLIVRGQFLASQKIALPSIGAGLFVAVVNSTDGLRRSTFFSYQK